MQLDFHVAISPRILTILLSLAAAVALGILI
jgi:hypothetical protein